MAKDRDDKDKQIEELKWLLSVSCQRGCSHEGDGPPLPTPEWRRYWDLREKYLGKNK